MPDTKDIPIGPDLDKAVAEACGGVYAMCFVPPNEWHFGDERISVDEFHPSTDANHALEAAEKAAAARSCIMELNCYWHEKPGGYFECRFWWTEGDDESGWVYPEVTGAGSTPAEAISRAIVALAEAP